jgi:hypothetical protein
MLSETEISKVKRILNQRFGSQTFTATTEEMSFVIEMFILFKRGVKVSVNPLKRVDLSLAVYYPDEALNKLNTHALIYNEAVKYFETNKDWCNEKGSFS